MVRSKVLSLSFFFLLCLSLNTHAANIEEIFDDINDLFESYVFIDSGIKSNHYPVVNPVAQLQLNDFQYSGSLGINLNVNNFYLNSLEKEIQKERQNYNDFNELLFRYEKINGDFFTIVTLFAEIDFLKKHPNLDFDIDTKIYTNKLYIELLRNAVSNYSGLNLDDNLINKYVDLLNEFDYSQFIVSDIYQFGLVKSAERRLAEETILYNAKNKKAYGYLPDLTLGFDCLNTIGTNQKFSFEPSFSMTIPNLGLSGNVKASIKDDNVLWTYSISFRFPFTKLETYELPLNEYSFSSESFLIELSGMLYSYNKLKNCRDIQEQYDLLLLKCRLIYAIKKYMELY